MNFKPKIYVIAALCLSLFAGSAFGVCLVTLPASRVLPELNVGRHQLRLFMKKSSSSKAAQWFDVPFQIDPLTKNERLLFPTGDAWKKESISKTDRILFRKRDLGEAKGKSVLPCAKNALEIRVEHGNTWRYGYLAYCPGSERPVAKSPLIQYIPQQLRLLTSQYLYQYHKSNQMLFQSVYLEDGGNFSSFLYESRLDIFADVKNFFNLHFDDSDIESKLEESSVRELGAVAVVSFYLKILFFKIKLSLTTDVNFFEDAASIPMFISLPVSGKDKLNPGSGILYSFRTGHGVVSSDIEMPLLQDGYTPKSKKWCSQNSCRYSVKFRRGNKSMAFNFKIPLSLAKEDFYPQFVRGQADLQKIPNFSKHLPDKNFVGFFFATSGLSEGQHPWDLGIQFDNASDDQISCYSNYAINKL